MGASFLLAASPVPYRTDTNGEYQILQNAELASKIAVNRLKDASDAELNSLQCMEILEAFIDGEVTREIIEERVQILVTELVQSYNSSETVIAVFDIPRIFSGGMSWGDTPTDAFDVCAAVNELRVFDVPLADDEIIDAVDADWI